MWTIPQSPFARPAAQAADARDVAGHAHTMAARMAPYQPRLVGTSQGRLWMVPAIPAGNSLTEQWPATLHMPHQHLPQPGGLAHQAADLDWQALAYPVQTIADVPGQPQLQAQAQFHGFTEAVPLRVHDAGDGWLCIGGKLTQNLEGAISEVTLPTKRFPRAPGIIGLLFTLEPESAAIRGAVWQFQDPAPSGQATAATVVFCPMWVVNPVLGRITSLGLQLPAERHPRYFTFLPAAPTGTVLTS